MVKSYVAHVIIVSPPVPQDLRFLTPLGLGLGLGLGGQGLGLWLDNTALQILAPTRAPGVHSWSWL